MNTNLIWCCACNKAVEARLTTGKEVYPYSGELRRLPFWKCDTCNGFVGCHHKTKNRTKPLGTISTKEIKNIRILLHKKIDILIEQYHISKRQIYQILSDNTNKDFHCGTVNSVIAGKEALAILNQIIDEDYYE